MSSKTKGKNEKKEEVGEKMPVTLSLLDDMVAFVKSSSPNPISQAKVIIAKNLSHSGENGNDAFTILYPLSAKNTFAYVKSYTNNQTGDVNYVLNICVLNDVSWNGAIGFHTFSSPHPQSENHKFSKGIRYAAKFAEYFDPIKNAPLFKSVKNGNIIINDVKYLDSDKVQYQQTSGFVEVIHLRQQYEGLNYGLVTVKCYNKINLSGERNPPKLFMLLNEEWAYFGAYMKFIIKAYDVVVGGESNVEQSRFKSNQKMILAALGKRKLQMEEERALKKSKKPKTKKKVAEKEKSPHINLEDALSAVEAVNSLRMLDSSSGVQKAASASISGDESEDEEAVDIDDYEENE